MKCPKCGTMMGYDDAAKAWVCYLRSCGNELTAKEIPALVAERDALTAENARLRAENETRQRNLVRATEYLGAERQINQRLRDQQTALGLERDALRGEVAQLRGTLDKYAEETNWSKVRDDRGQAYYWFDPITYDCPEPWVPAQDALK